MKIPIINPRNCVKCLNEHQTRRPTRSKFEYFLSYRKKRPQNISKSSLLNSYRILHRIIIVAQVEG